MIDYERVNWSSISFQEFEMLLRMDENVLLSIDTILSSGNTPLGSACKHNREDLVTILLDYGAEPNKSSDLCNRRPLHFACDHSDGNLGIVTKLLEAQAELNVIDDDGNSCLHLACRESNLRVVKILVDHGASPHFLDEEGETALIRACFANCVEIIDFLLKNGSNPNDCRGQALEIAVRISSFESLKLLIQYGGKMDRLNLMPIACEKGHIEMMKLLHNYGVDLDRCNSLGMSPLHLSCLNETASPTTVRLLLQWGANPNYPSHVKETPLHYACISRSLEKIRLLLAYGASPNICDSHQLSPLLMAFNSPGLSLISMKIVNLLIAAGSQVTVECLNGLKSISTYLPHSQARQDLLNLLELRLSGPPPLQWLCRFQVRFTVRPNVDENVQKLPLPPQIIRFLNFHDIVGGDTSC